jgi:MFS family permease
MLVAGRAVQGLGGGGVVVLVHVCVSDLFSIRDRSFYMGTVGAVWALASALGPVLGGIFAEKLNWRWCFYVNIPIVSCSIIALYFTLHLQNPRTSLFNGLKSMDWLGTFTIITATILLLVGLQVGGTSSYGSPPVITCLVFGSVAYIAFPFSQWWEDRRGGSPIMPLRIFKDISNLSALGVCACDALVFNSVAYFLPLYFQIVLNRSPTTTGVYMLAIAVPLATISFASGHVVEKTGRFLEVLQAGLFVMTLGVGLLISLDASLHLGKIIGILIVVGQVVFQLLMAPHLQGFVDNGISEQFATMLAGGEAISQAMTVTQLSAAHQVVVREGFMNALRGTWILYTVIGTLGLVVSFGIKRTKLRRETQCTELGALEGSPTGSGSSGLASHH